MCRLLITLSKSKPRQSQILTDFSKLAICGMVPKGEPAGHLDGWGICVFQDGKNTVLQKQISPPDNNPALKNIIKKLEENPGDLVIAHLRKASIGKEGFANTHPFQCGAYYFAHNGTILDYEKIQLTEKYQRLAAGETDSEVFFLLIMQILEDDKQFSRQPQDNITKKDHVTAAIKKAIAYAKENLDYTALNFALTDGETVWVTRHYNPNNRFVIDLAMADYYTLFIGYQDQMPAVICSEKLPGTYRWESMENNEILIIEIFKN